MTRFWKVAKMVNFAKAIVRQNGQKMAILGLKKKNMRKTTLEKDVTRKHSIFKKVYASEKWQKCQFYKD